jgi:CheY-like chemotaxis protein
MSTDKNRVRYPNTNEGALASILIRLKPANWRAQTLLLRWHEICCMRREQWINQAIVAKELTCWRLGKFGENQMQELIMVVAAEPKDCRAISGILEHNNYGTAALDSLFDLPKNIRSGPFRAVILDLDSLPVDNRFIRDLRKQNPEVPIIALSSRTFHPELQEAMSLYISACLAKPVNPDELGLLG